MCGRYIFFTPEEFEEYREVLRRIARSLKAGIAVLDIPQDQFSGKEIFPGNVAPVIPSVNNIDDLPDRSYNPVRLMNWGFPLNQKTSQKIINARSETIETKYMFKKCLGKKRCIVPAKGFYEWKKEETGKTKTSIRISGQNAMFMAGLYDEFDVPGKGKILCYTIITTAANPQISPIHDRMPALLEERHFELWLNDRLFANYRNDLTKILRPYEGQLEILPLYA